MNFDSFSIIVSSDPQYSWYDKVNPENLPEDQIKENAERQIRQQYEDMDHLSNEKKDTPFPVKGVLINGDLTEYGHDWQLSKYRELLATLSIPYYPGLGNHDYANNINGCTGHDCAARMVEFMHDWLRLHRAQLNDYDFAADESYQGELRTHLHGSLSYSFNLGRVHFVQLHNFPSYRADWNSWDHAYARRKFFSIRPSFHWLEHDLAIARNRGDAILVNLHDYEEHFKEPERQKFHDLLRKYNVAAVFAGHLHWDCKLVATVPRTNIPVFRSGSAGFQDYLYAEIDTTRQQMTVFKRLDATLEGKYAKTADQWAVSLPMTVPSPALPVPLKEGYVTFFNEGGFAARFTLSYLDQGTPRKFETGSIALGNKVTYFMPPDATDVEVKGEEQTGLAWEGWRTVFNEKFPSPPNNCFKLFGTTLSPKWNNDCK